MIFAGIRRLLFTALILLGSISFASAESFVVTPNGFTKSTIQTFCPSGCTTTIAGGSSGTYTPTSGTRYAIIECIGGGGGGGGIASAAVANYGSGGGGGSGGYSRKLVTAATIGASQTVTIGIGGAGGTAGNNAGTNGGDTSTGSLCVGNGGTGGGANAGTASATATGGAGGVSGTGDMRIVGTSGAPGIASTSASFGGAGGDGVYGGGGQYTIVFANTAATGKAGTAPGGGGAGGISGNTGANAAGGAGLAGYVIITEYGN